MSDFYPLKPFRITQHEAMLQIISAYPLATLISGSESEKDISLIPLMGDLDQDGAIVLTGHVDGNNPQTDKLVPGEHVAFVFNGPDAYASPDIYADEQLPGWFYVMVKGTGSISRLIESEEAIQLLCDSSSRFGGSSQRFSLEKEDPRFDLFIGGIVGFEIKVASITGIAKLAQDKGPEHSSLACRFLGQADNRGLAEFLRDMRDASG